MQHCQTATGCHGGWAPWVAIDKALMQRQGTDTANEKKMLQRIKLTDKEVPDDIDKHSSCLNGYIRILYIYIYTGSRLYTRFC